MPLFSVLDTDPSVKELANKVASLLGTPSRLESIVRVPTAKAGVNLFQFKWTEDFQSLADQLARAMAHNIQRTAEEVAGVRIRSFPSDEKCFETGVLLLIESVLTIPNDGLVILLPIPLSSDAFKDALRQLPVFQKLKETARSFGHGEATLYLQSLDRNNRCGMKLQPESTTIIYGGVRFETIPTTPFFMLSLPTVTVEGRDVVEEST